MAVSVDPSSLGMDIFKPDQVYPDAEVIWAGGDPFVNLFLRDPAVSEHGIRLKGDAKFVLSPGDSLKGWKVGFIQIVRMGAYRVRYTGRMFSEGSVVIDVLVPGGLSTNVLLDCYNQTAIPWMYSAPDGTEFKGPLAHAVTQDNPHRPVPATLENQKVRKVKNFLYDLSWQCEFWTMLTAMSPTKSLQFLGYLHWQFEHKVDFYWQLGGPQPSVQGTFKIVDKFQSGPPKDPALQSILSNPAGPIANDEFNKAIDAAFKRKNSRTCLDADRGLSPMRADFWDVPANAA
jgi:hypothetical protein